MVLLMNGIKMREVIVPHHIHHFLSNFILNNKIEDLNLKQNYSKSIEKSFHF